MGSSSVGTVAIPKTDDELVRYLAGAAEPALIGGGTMLMPRIARGEQAPDVLIDLFRLPGARRLEVTPTSTVVGPMVTYADLLRHSNTPPLLRRIAGTITGGPQIRNQGTLGGSACYANPASDVPTALVASNAVMEIVGADENRLVNAADFFQGPFQTRLQTGEALVSITLPPIPHHPAFGYCKIKGSESSWPIVTAAALGADDGVLTVVLGAAVTRPVILTFSAIDQTPFDSATIDDAVRTQNARWWTDELADGGYRRRVAPVAIARAISEARRRAPEWNGQHL